MKLLFPFYAGSIGSLAAISSPGIALVEEFPQLTGYMGIAMEPPPIKDQNELVRAQVDWSDRVLQSFQGYHGTGSNTQADRVWYETASFSLPGPSKKLPANVPVLLDVASVVAEIRSCLSLQIKELAEILGVQRPTIYSWLEGDQRPQANKRLRLLELLKVARAWSQISEQPIGKAVRDRLDEDGRSLLDQLKRESLNHDQIAGHLRALLDFSVESPRKRSILELAKENDFDLSSVRDQREIVDIVTGKRTHEE